MSGPTRHNLPQVAHLRSRCWDLSAPGLRRDCAGTAGACERERQPQRHGRCNDEPALQDSTLPTDRIRPDGGARRGATAASGFWFLVYTGKGRPALLNGTAAGQQMGYFSASGYGATGSSPFGNAVSTLPK